LYTQAAAYIKTEYAISSTSIVVKYIIHIHTTYSSALL